MSRHAERYPTANAGGRMLELVKRMRESGIEFKGDLEFVNDWEYFSDAPEKHHEQLTTTGPYAGVLEAFTTGVKLRTRYEHLIVTSMTTGGSRNTTHLWASHSSRVIATARYFSAGFFGLDWNQQSQTAAAAELHVIPETDDLGADTLTPGDTCLRYRDDLEYGHDYGAAMLVKFRATYLGGIADRLQKQNPHVRFTHQEIYSMQEMCGFETLVRGKSQWCHVFTRLDWMNFEYARDVIHLYRAGPGNRYGPAMGWLWLNATANLLATGPSAGPLFFSFVHDGDIIPMIAALQLFPSSHDLPVTHVDRNRTWRTSQLTPMGGRVIFERLSCRSTSTSHRHQDKQDNNIYVRINVNDGIVALPGCDGGPGKSCPLGDFANLVRKRGEEVGDFRQVCGLGPDAADRITFLHQ
ncbi:MAG: acid phosphatase pho5 [Peltula sp. TS41687]|nr:MAG: acid phosphatase pho5 [Peltula sp. TS41687]